MSMSCGVVSVDNQQATFPTGRAREGKISQERLAKETPALLPQGYNER